MAEFSDFMVAARGELDRRRGELSLVEANVERLQMRREGLVKIVDSLTSALSAMEAEVRVGENLPGVASGESASGAVDHAPAAPAPKTSENAAPVYQGKATPAKISDLDGEVAQRLRRIQAKLQRWVLREWAMDWASFLEHNEQTARKRMVVGRWLVHHCRFYPKEAGALLGASAMNVGSWSGQFEKRATADEVWYLEGLRRDLGEFEGIGEEC